MNCEEEKQINEPFLYQEGFIVYALETITDIRSK
jgi:hypothetical protein